MSAAFVPIVGGLVGRGRKTEAGGLLAMIVGGGLFGLLKLYPDHHDDGAAACGAPGLFRGMDTR